MKRQTATPAVRQRTRSSREWRAPWKLPSPSGCGSHGFRDRCFSLSSVLALVGGYLAFTIPVSVFPSTDFPRIVIGVDNGVAPIDQMLVTITKPIEEAVNSVPGLQNVRSITSRGSAEIDLFFDWNSDMVLTLQTSRRRSRAPSVRTSR